MEEGDLKSLSPPTTRLSLSARPISTSTHSLCSLHGSASQLSQRCAFARWTMRSRGLATTPLR